MILVDSSVWIDYLNGTATPETDRLDELLGRETVAIGDLILTEVLRGFHAEREFHEIRRRFHALPLVELGGRQVAVRAAENFRMLRQLGITVRRTIDCIIATRCIVDGHRLLHSDRDFEPFIKHLGLRVA